MEKHNNMNFTENANSRFYREIHTKDFHSDPTAIISKTIKHEMQLLKCGDYLKRYICRKLNRTDMTDDDYLNYITDSFERSGTPASFTASSKHIRTYTKNWLSMTKCKKIDRMNILLIGLGLGMRPSEVNELLTKGILEQELNPKDPYEAICWYCYQYCPTEFGHYAMYNDLKEQYEALTVNPFSRSRSQMETSVMRIDLESVNSPAKLMEYLAPLKFDGTISRFSLTAYKKFLELYNRLQSKIEEEKVNDVEMDKRIRNAKKRTVKKSDPENSEVANPKISKEGMAQNYIYGGLHKTKDGDLPKEALSDFFGIFNTKRLDKNRFKSLLATDPAQRKAVERSDLITLKFLDFCMEEEILTGIAEDPQKLNEERLEIFIDETNRLLADCFMHPIIPQNPYEAFLLRCMAADDPREIYNQVLEQSYHYPDKEET